MEQPCASSSTDAWSWNESNDHPEQIGQSLEPSCRFESFCSNSHQQMTQLFCRCNNCEQCLHALEVCSKEDGRISCAYFRVICFTWAREFAKQSMHTGVSMRMTPLFKPDPYSDTESKIWCALFIIRFSYGQSVIHCDNLDFHITLGYYRFVHDRNETDPEIVRSRNSAIQKWNNAIQKIEGLLSEDIVINIDQPLVKLDATQLVQFRICYGGQLIKSAESIVTDSGFLTLQRWTNDRGVRKTLKSSQNMFHVSLHNRRFPWHAMRRIE